MYNTFVLKPPFQILMNVMKTLIGVSIIVEIPLAHTLASATLAIA